ncbi:MAG: glycosyltransferase family 2 protein [Candidatus Zixiibacteriota bacterium]
MDRSTLVAVVAFNEGDKVRRLVKQFPERHDYDVLFVDDGSTDDCCQCAAKAGHQVINHGSNRGVGAAIRTAIEYGRSHRYLFLVIMAANGKMLPAEIGRLTGPLQNNEADYVQGSRYLEGGQSPNLPLFRKVTIRIFTAAVNFVSNTNLTDVTCGFRAYRLDLFDNPKFRLNQSWLDRYEMEYYIHYHVLSQHYRVAEVPVSMVYPTQAKNYSKIRPITGWWSMIRPWVYLVLRIKS